MKVLGIVCSPRKRGNTEIMVGESLSAAKELGAETELITLADKRISPCDGCEACQTTRECRINDDMREIYSKLLESDGIIFGTPVYFWTVTAQAKALIDRTYVFREGRRLRNKAAGVVIVARRAGASQTFSVFQNFFNIQRMVPVGGAIGYEEIGLGERGGGAIAYADKKGEVKQDDRGMVEARALGKAVVRTIKILQSPQRSD